MFKMGMMFVPDFFLMIRRQPRSTLFPNTTLFRSRPGGPSAAPVEGAAPRPPMLGEKRGAFGGPPQPPARGDRQSTRLNSSHANISYAVFCLKKNILRTSVIPIYAYSSFAENLMII